MSKLEHVDSTKRSAQASVGGSPSVQGVPPNKHADELQTHMRRTDAFRPREVHQASHPSVSAGAQLTRGKYPSGIGGIGTAGLVVRSNGESSGAAVLTCAHVLGPPLVAENTDGDGVYSPNPKIVAGISCRNPFGQVVPWTLPPKNRTELQAQLIIDQETFGVDASLIQVAGDGSASNKVSDDRIGLINGTRDLIDEWHLSATPQIMGADNTLALPTQVPVRKCGASTQYSEGKTVGLRRQALVDAPTATALVLEIEATGQWASVSRSFDVDIDRFRRDTNLLISTIDEVVALFKPPATATRIGSASSNSIQVTGPSFSEQGDSGAPVVDETGKIIGIIASGTSVPLYVTGEQNPVNVTVGNTQVIFIEAALQAVKATFIPAVPTAGAAVIVPGMAIAAPRGEQPAWDDAWTAYRDTPRGERLSAVVSRHFAEISDLAHHDRRVKLAWHRHKGPAFAVALIRGTHRLPAEIDGVRREDGIRAMRDALMTRGSPALRAAIIEYGDDVAALLSDGPESTVLAGGGAKNGDQ